MFSHQAMSPVIRARVQALIRRRTGSKAHAAVLSCLLAGSRARGLSWKDSCDVVQKAYVADLW